MEYVSSTVFSSPLGWNAVSLRESRVARLSFGHSSDVDAEYAAAAWRDSLGLLAADDRGHPQPADGTIKQILTQIVRRLRAFMAGEADDFLDVAIDDRGMTEYHCRVIDELRRVPIGRTISYGELAARAGSPGAARAAGNFMAGNQVPLVIPCHRVIRSDGGLGGFSAPSGIAMKKRLLNMEARMAGQML